MQISADFIHVACDWRPRGYNFHATGGHLDTIYIRLAATPVQFIQFIGGQFFASTRRGQLFELKNEDAIKKSENLRDTCAC